MNNSTPSSQTEEILKPTTSPDIDTAEDNELYEHHRLVVDPGQEMLRIDKYLVNHLQNVSRSKIQAAAAAGCIVVNDRSVKSNYRVKPKDTISILLPEPVHELSIDPEDIPINIVYEDNDLLVVDKQAGLVVHPGHGNYTGTLLNALTFHFIGQQQPDGTPTTAYLAHRIDKNTSGLLVVAKNEATQAHLARQFFYHTIERKYQALVWGAMDSETGTVDANIERSAKDRRVMTVTHEPERGKHAVTHWRVIEPLGYVSLVECQLETGRTHQIRTHMQSIGHPLFNDEAYGGSQILKGTTFSKYKQFVDNCFKLLPRQALHAAILGFEHPTTHKQMHFESPMPDDMQAVIAKWRAYASGSLGQSVK